MYKISEVESTSIYGWILSTLLSHPQNLLQRNTVFGHQSHYQQQRQTERKEEQEHINKQDKISWCYIALEISIKYSMWNQIRQSCLKSISVPLLPHLYCQVFEIIDRMLRKPLLLLLHKYWFKSKLLIFIRNDVQYAFIDISFRHLVK